MAWQNPNNDQCNDFITASSLASWEAEFMAQPPAEYDAAIPFLHQQYPTPGSGNLNAGNAASSTEDYLTTVYPYQAEIARGLGGIDGLFENKQTTNTCYFSAGLLFSSTERSHDASSSELLNPVALTRSNTQRKSRARQPGYQEWERHKDAIYDFYLKQNFSLATTMKKLKEIHQFSATEKMYKDKFKQWKWSKNLPGEVAVGMLSKANRRRPKETIFHWNNQAWPIERVMKSCARFASDDDSHIPEDCPTPPGVTCETPRLPNITNNPRSLEKLQRKNSSLEPVDENSPDTTKKPLKSIDEGPFYIKSVAAVRSVLQSALEARKEDNREEAESGLRDALSCSSYLLSPTHNETLKIGYMLASIYANRGRMDDADDTLDWMTRKHIRSFEKVLGIWKTSGDPGKLAAMQDILEALASDSNNHKLLRFLLPRYIESCSQQTNGKLIIQSKCILAEIWVKGSQFETAKNILREGGHLLKQQVAAEYPLEHSTLKLAQRVAFTFLEACDTDECVKILDDVAVVAVAHIAEGGNIYGMLVTEFLTSTATELHQRSACGQSRPWVERAFSLSCSLFGQEHERTKDIGRMLETCNIDNISIFKETLKSLCKKDW
ncbi:hypothetical protein TrVFT333_007675 [Trichoderma virens FT-333]|nr:hypothetical protein TrVFT333_007675 [Trichoderma virens FT-333]